MGFFDFFKQSNINQGIEEYKMTAGAVLLCPYSAGISGRTYTRK